MAIFNTRVALAAGAVNNNVMAGSKFEFLGRPSAVRVWATEDGAGSLGAGGTGALIDWTLGNAVVGDDLRPNSTATAGVINRQQDGLGQGGGDAGDRIQLRVQNSDGVNAVNVTFQVEIAEIA